MPLMFSRHALLRITHGLACVVWVSHRAPGRYLLSSCLLCLAAVCHGPLVDRLTPGLLFWWARGGYAARSSYLVSERLWWSSLVRALPCERHFTFQHQRQINWQQAFRDRYLVVAPLVLQARIVLPAQFIVWWTTSFTYAHCFPDVGAENLLMLIFRSFLQRPAKW